MTVRHCLDCDALVTDDSRCPLHRKARDRAFTKAGRQRRGPKWAAKSKRLRTFWSNIGATCVEASDGLCKGTIQADHISATIFAPRCAYHNNRKH